ncbi:MAG: hypothetical protein ACRD5W_08045 [Candidatus Acidiferrales bacterium]
MGLTGGRRSARGAAGAVGRDVMEHRRVRRVERDDNRRRELRDGGLEAGRVRGVAYLAGFAYGTIVAMRRVSRRQREGTRQQHREK